MDFKQRNRRADGLVSAAGQLDDPELSEVTDSVSGMEMRQQGGRADGLVSGAAQLALAGDLSVALDALAAATAHDREHASDVERLAWLRAAQALARRSEALYKQLVAEADQAGSTMRLHGTPTTSWLALDGRLSSREAAGLVNSGKTICSRAEVAKLTLNGNITAGQATAIGKVIAELPPTLTNEQVQPAETILITKAADTNADDIRKSTGSIIEEVTSSPSPEDAALAEQLRLAEQRRRARRRRGLHIWDDGDGSTRFKGSLPTVEAEAFRRLIAAYTEADRRRGRDQGDPRAAERSPEQRRADALVQLLADHETAGKGAPSVAGDRPRVVVIMQEESLRQRAEQAGLLPGGGSVAAGDLRRILCDAELAPTVLGGNSEILDVGRSNRLVTATIRRALSVRDGCCQFPNCQTVDERCEAHHIRPWWAGGETSLANLVLLCPHHHKLIEPERFWINPGADSWQVRARTDGRAEFLPPTRVDPARTPIAGNAAKRASQGRTPPAGAAAESMTRTRPGPTDDEPGLFEQDWGEPPDLKLGA